jgi:hypothetical protein
LRAGSLKGLWSLNVERGKVARTLTWTMRVGASIIGHARSIASAVIILALGALSAIAVFGFRAVDVVEVTIQSHLLDHIVLTSTTVSQLEPVNHRYVIFDFNGIVTMPVPGLRLRLRSGHDPSWFNQPCCQVSGTSFFGTAQLGSAEWPLVKDERLTFQLLSEPDATLLAEGTIQARVTPLRGTEPWVQPVIAWVGLVAALLQIATHVKPIRSPRGRANNGAR